MPASRAGLLLTLARFAFRDKSVVLLTQGLGAQPFHNKMVVLINEWTNSAAEMVANFAAENRLATIVGKRTAGNVLGTMNFRVGSATGCGCPYLAGTRLAARAWRETAFAQMCRLTSFRTLAAGEDNQLSKAIEMSVPYRTCQGATREQA